MSIKRWTIFSITILAIISTLFQQFATLAQSEKAQSEKVVAPPQNSTENSNMALKLALSDLTYPFTIMCMAAHPDDEDSDGLAYFRTKYGARTIIVTATRGEGGQNSQGPELYEDLGIVRTKEMAAAAQKLGAETFNLALPDFGYSKTAEDTFRYWNRRDALRRFVYAIRLYKPDIIITQHDRKTGHGQHQATRILAEEAFDLAADRYSFPEQLSVAGLLPWKTRRMFLRTISKTRFDVEFEANGIAAKLNKPYSQIGYESRTEHRTQGPWPEPDYKAERLVRYSLIKNIEGDFLKWYLIDQELTPSPLYKLIQPMIFNSEMADVDQVVELPRNELIKRLTNAINSAQTYIKTDEGKYDLKARDIIEKLRQTLLLVLKLELTLSTSTNQIFPGADFNAKVTLKNDSPLPLEISEARFNLPAEWEYKETEKFTSNMVEAGATNSAQFNLQLSQQATPTLPITNYLYTSDLMEPQVTAYLQVKWKDLAQPITIFNKARVEVTPLIEFESTPSRIVANTFDNGFTNSYPLQIKLTNHGKMGLSGHIRMPGYQAIKATPEDQEFSLLPDKSIVITIFITIGRPVPEGKLLLPIMVSDSYGREVLTKNLEVSLINVRTYADLKVGYLRSFDNTLPQSLKFLEVDSAELSIGEIAAGGLIQRYNTIILDNRAYLAYPDLKKVNSKLLDFVREGGTLIVFYQRPSEWNNNNLSPYPIKLGDDRICDETAPVTILQSNHALLSRPNKVSSEDFNNWIQERGLNFPMEWDERYTALLSSADADEDQLKGGLLVTEYGKGNYIYTSYSIYRQLRANNSGAFHLFANMLSLSKTR